MKLEKTFNITVSHRFPNGDIVSVNFGTHKSVDNIIDEVNPDAVKELSTTEAKWVRNATMRDIKKAIEVDELVREVWEGAKAAVKSQKNMRAAEEALDE